MTLGTATCSLKDSGPKRCRRAPTARGPHRAWGEGSPASDAVADEPGYAPVTLVGTVTLLDGSLIFVRSNASS